MTSVPSRVSIPHAAQNFSSNTAWNNSASTSLAFLPSGQKSSSPPPRSSPASRAKGANNPSLASNSPGAIPGLNYSAFDPSNLGLTSAGSGKSSQEMDSFSNHSGRPRASSPSRVMSRSISTDQLFTQRTTSCTYIVAAAGSHRWVILGE